MVLRIRDLRSNLSLYQSQRIRRTAEVYRDWFTPHQIAHNPVQLKILSQAYLHLSNHPKRRPSLLSSFQVMLIWRGARHNVKKGGKERRKRRNRRKRQKSNNNFKKDSKFTQKKILPRKINNKDLSLHPPVPRPYKTETCFLLRFQSLAPKLTWPPPRDPGPFVPWILEGLR